MEQPTEKNPTNVVQFPNVKLDSPPQSLEELSSQIEEYRMNFADEISEALMNMVVGELSRTGINLEAKGDSIVSSVILLHESIKAIYLRACDIEHPLHEIADDCFSVGNEEECTDDDNDDKISEEE